MKKLAFAFLLLVACSRDTVERASPPVSTTEPASDTATATATGTPEAPPSSVPPPAPVAGGRTLAFADEGTRDASFVAYRDRLLAAVRARDAKGVSALADPKIRTSFGGDGGRAGLEKVLARPGMFEELELILTLGGSFQGEGDTAFWAPYVYSAYPDEQDAFSTLAVIGDDIPLHESPDAGSTVIATLSRNIVERLSEPGDDGPWQKVKAGEKVGFVETKFLRSPIDYRAGFNKFAEGWRMTGLVAGD